MAVNCEKVVGDLFAAWTRLNVDEVMSHFAEDAVWDNVPMSPAKGKQAIREMTQGFMKDASAFSVNILIVCGSEAGLRWILNSSRYVTSCGFAAQAARSSEATSMDRLL